MNDNQWEIIRLFFFALAAFVAGSIIGVKINASQSRASAVKAGVAEWVASEDGSPKFQWKQPRP